MHTTQAHLEEEVVVDTGSSLLVEEEHYHLVEVEHN